MEAVSPATRRAARPISRAGSNRGLMMLPARPEQQALVDQNGRMPMLSGLLIRVGPAQQIAILKPARRDLQAERKAALIEAARHHDGRNADPVHPSGSAAGAPAQLSVLRHGFIGWRHLCGGIYIAVEVKLFEDFVVKGQSLALRLEKVCFGVRIGLERDLCDGWLISFAGIPVSVPGKGEPTTLA